MFGHIWSVWIWLGLNRPGFCMGTCSLLTLMLLVYAGGIQASLSLGPGGDFPKFRDVFLYAVSHDDITSLIINVVLLLLVGPCQERCWGTVAFLALSIFTMTILPFLYTLALFVGGGEASRICGYSAILLALFTAQCRHVTQRRLLRCLPVWFLPWSYLLIGLLLLPGTPALLHFCAVCIGHNYDYSFLYGYSVGVCMIGNFLTFFTHLMNSLDHQSFIGMFQELEEARVLELIPDWAYVSTLARFRLPTYTTTRMPANQAAVHPMRDSSVSNQQPWMKPLPAWIMEESAIRSETEVLDEQMLRAGILASLQDNPDDPDAKVEVAKSSVSSLRLQQLERMGFPTEKAVVALAASKQLDGAISLLIDDSVGEQAVVVSKGKSPPIKNT